MGLLLLGSYDKDTPEDRVRKAALIRASADISYIDLEFFEGDMFNDAMRLARTIVELRRLGFKVEVPKE